MAHPWIAAAQAAGHGVFTSSRAWHRSLAARALATTLAAKGRHLVDGHPRSTHPTLPLVEAGGIPISLMDLEHLFPKHGRWERDGRLLFVFSDHTVLAGQRDGAMGNARLVPWIWRLREAPPHADLLPEGSALAVSTMGNKGPRAKTMLCLKGVGVDGYPWTINLDPAIHDKISHHFPQKHHTGHARLRAALDAAMDSLVDTLEHAPALSHRIGDVGGTRWIPPFQSLDWGKTSLQQHPTLGDDLATLTGVLGAEGLTLMGHAWEADGTVDALGVARGLDFPEGHPSGDGTKAQTQAMDATLLAAFQAILARHGLPPYALVYQEQDKPKAPLETNLLFCTLAAQASAHERVAFLAAMAAQGVHLTQAAAAAHA